MRSQRKEYETPTRAWQEERIEDEKRIREDYGLKNKKEVWKAQSTVRKFRRQARELNAEDHPEQEQELKQKMERLGITDADPSLNDILDTDIEDVLERRLQTIIYRRGLADTPKEARQMVVHGHIQIDEQTVTVPGYLVTVEEEEDVRIAPDSKHLVEA